MLILRPRQCLQTSVWFPDDPARKALLQRWAIAFLHCAMDHVREDCDLEPLLKVVIPRSMVCNWTERNRAHHAMLHVKG